MMLGVQCMTNIHILGYLARFTLIITDVMNYVFRTFLFYIKLYTKHHIQLITPVDHYLAYRLSFPSFMHERLYIQQDFLECFQMT